MLLQYSLKSAVGNHNGGLHELYVTIHSFIVYTAYPVYIVVGVLGHKVGHTLAHALSFPQPYTVYRISDIDDEWQSGVPIHCRAHVYVTRMLFSSYFVCV